MFPSRAEISIPPPCLEEGNWHCAQKKRGRVFETRAPVLESVGDLRRNRSEKNEDAPVGWSGRSAAPRLSTYFCHLASDSAVSPTSTRNRGSRLLYAPRSRTGPVVDRPTSRSPRISPPSPSLPLDFSFTPVKKMDRIDRFSKRVIKKGSGEGGRTKRSFRAFICLSVGVEYIIRIMGWLMSC